MNKVKISIIGLTVLALVVVVLQNTQATTVRAFGAEATMPMAFLLGLTGAVGFACGLFSALFLGRKSKLPKP